MHGRTVLQLNAKRHQHRVTGHTSTKCSFIIIVFVATACILAISVIYLGATFPSLEDADVDADHWVIEYSGNIKFETQPKEEVNNTLKLMVKHDDAVAYNETISILIRAMHESSVYLDATPFLVGLGAEKSGSTSLGAALFHSGEVTPPDRDEINVETKYWSDCFDWNVQKDTDALIQSLLRESGGHCSIQQYQSFARWRQGRFQFEKSVDYLGLPYITRIFSDIFVKKHRTKIFVMIRYPPPRISSTWKFFVGNEKDTMPNEYGNVERFTMHLLKNELLMELLELLKTQEQIMDLDWKYVILPKWNEYMLSLLEQCKEEAVIAGFKSEFCNPSQLLRRAIGLSCYVVPLMQWIIDMGIEDAMHQFRIIQSELYFENGKDIMDRLICWSKQGTMDVDKCDTTQLYAKGSIKIKKLQGTVQSGTSDFSDELIHNLHSVFEPCNVRLFQLLQLYPQLALKEFDWNYWHFEAPK